ncbi:hypothetical protein GCM10009719_14020 [Nocardioides kribbensis]
MVRESVGRGAAASPDGAAEAAGAAGAAPDCEAVSGSASAAATSDVLATTASLDLRKVILLGRFRVALQRPRQAARRAPSDHGRVGRSTSCSRHARPRAPEEAQAIVTES